MRSALLTSKRAPHAITASSHGASLPDRLLDDDNWWKADVSVGQRARDTVLLGVVSIALLNPVLRFLKKMGCQAYASLTLLRENVISRNVISSLVPVAVKAGKSQVVLF